MNEGGEKGASEQRPAEIQIAEASANAPTPLSMTVSLEPRMAAGVELAKRVLVITFTAIGILSAYLIIMEVYIGRDVRSAYAQALGKTDVEQRVKTLATVDRFIGDLEALVQIDSGTLNPSALANANRAVDLLKGVRVAPADLAILGKCQPPPQLPARSALLRACIRVLEQAREAIATAELSEGAAGVAADFAAKVLDERKALRDFWLQAAQLILLNLLLPLLTALFGYVFGTQQGASKQGS